MGNTGLPEGPYNITGQRKTNNGQTRQRVQREIGCVADVFDEMSRVISDRSNGTVSRAFPVRNLSYHPVDVRNVSQNCYLFNEFGQSHSQACHFSDHGRNIIYGPLEKTWPVSKCCITNTTFLIIILLSFLITINTFHPHHHRIHNSFTSALK